MTKRYEVVETAGGLFIKDNEQRGMLLDKQYVNKLACAALNAGLTVEAIERGQNIPCGWTYYNGCPDLTCLVVPLEGK